MSGHEGAIYVSRGPTAIWESLYNDHASRVFGYALRRLPREEALDVVAETFLVAWRRLDEVPNDPLPWLLAVARNTISNEKRAQRRRETLQARLTMTAQRPSDETSDPMEEVGSRQVVTDALRRLPEAEREAFTLVVWEGLNPRQGAKVLGCTPTAFTVRVHRARRRLARELALGKIRHRKNQSHAVSEVEAR